MSDGRSRCWTFIIYPSEEYVKNNFPDCKYDGIDGWGKLPDDFIDILNEYHVEFFISPLHCYDFNPDGSIKKPHFHIVVYFGSVKSYEQIIEEFVSPLHGAIPQRVHNLRSMVRYLVHLDNPEKYQYNLKDIITLGGADVFDALKPSMSERVQYIAEMEQFIQDYNITELFDLRNYARTEHFDDWYFVLNDKCTSSQINQFITSFRHSTLKLLKNDLNDLFEEIAEKQKILDDLNLAINKIK